MPELAQRVAFDAELAGKVFGLFGAELAHWQEETTRVAGVDDPQAGSVRNNVGQSTPPTGTYAAVSSESAAVNTVDGNGMHACALRTDGTIVCWGDQIP